MQYKCNIEKKNIPRIKDQNKNIKVNLNQILKCMFFITMDYNTFNISEK